ncbi:MAG: sarcosine oxidase subunit gamma family protein [Hyphomicrobiaceae bacterium]
MADLVMSRASALVGLSLPSKAGVAAVSDPGAVTRFIYRGASELSPATIGIALPTTPMRAHAEGQRTALWLGPDEWLLLSPDADGSAVGAALAETLVGPAASLVDVSHRQVGLIVTGPRAAELLNAGCPLDLDLSAFPVGMCTRTVLAKIEIVLWRTAVDDFRIEVARSLAPYVVELLREALFGVV